MVCGEVSSSASRRVKIRRLTSVGKEHVREMFSGDSQMITIIITIQNDNKKNKIRLAIMIVVLSNGNKTE